MTPLKLGTASKSNNSKIKILSAISISVNARNRCTGEVTRSTQNHNHSGGLHDGRSAVDCTKSDGWPVDDFSRVETRSTPAFARCYPRSFTFYLGNPFPRFLDSWFVFSVRGRHGRHYTIARG